MKKWIIGSGIIIIFLVATLVGTTFVFAKDPGATDTDIDEQPLINDSTIIADEDFDDDNIEHEFDGEEEHED